MVTILTFLYFLSIMTQLWYWYFYFNKLITHGGACTSEKDSAFLSNTLPIDLIICLYKRETKLFENLSAFLNQDYPCYRLLLICDSIGDALFEEISRLKSKYQHLELIRIENNSGGKKGLLATCIRQSTDRILALSDADCFPASKHWLSLMAQKLHHSNADIILGFSPYQISKGSSLLQKWSLFEAQVVGVQYLSAALWKNGYMGVGRNLMYAPNVLNPSLLESHEDILSGDDDLTISQLSKTHKISICTSPESFVYTYPQKNWRSYFNQKRRHFSTAHRYRLGHILMLGLFSLSHITSYLLFALVLFHVPLISLTGFVLRWILIGLQAKKVLAALKQSIYIKDFIWLDALQFIYYIVFSFSVLFPKKQKW